jgi:uncharacterized protein
MHESPKSSGTNMARIIGFLRAYKRLIAWLAVFLVVAYSAFRLIHPGEFGRFYDLFGIALNVVLIASQVFWIRRVGELGKRLIRSKGWRRGLAAAGLIVYFFLLANDLLAGEDTFKGSGLTLRAVVLEAPFKLWLLGSLLGFLVALSLWIPDRVVRAVSWAFKKLIAPPRPELLSPSRRRFLGQTAIVLSAAPFVAGTYGLFYGRLNLETTHQRIRLRRLPKAFEGFRILQLSDIHISAFMSAEEIRKNVAIANQLKADLVVLTGDFVTWEEAMEGAVVQALSSLKAPFGVFGCLGNHENLTQTGDSITRLFAMEGIQVLRQAHVPIRTGGESINLIGVDFQSLFGGRYDPLWPPQAYLQGVERLMSPDTANILLSHNPNTFDRAAELGIDLSLAGHTHGGQVNFEFIHPALSPARLITPYVRGWFQKRDAQLYVNRGIGTLGVPARFGSPPEISVFELTRET